MGRVVLLWGLTLLGLLGVDGADTTVNPACGNLPADIEFLLDTSGSVQSSNFAKVRAFVAKFANDFQIGPNAVQIGVATFDTHARNEFWMNQHLDRPSLLTAINAIRYPAGSTHTDEALLFVRQSAFTKAHGDRDRVANILIVVTDGQSNNKTATLAEAAELHKTSINVFAVGVGSSVDQTELSAIASKSSNVFTVSNFDALDSIQAQLRKTACEVDGAWSSWGFYSPCTVSCGGGTQYRERTCTNPAPANGGQTCQGNARETGTCNTAACTTTPPPTTKPPPTVATTPIPGCGLQPADILFIVDASGSVGDENFRKTLAFLYSMVSGFTIGPSDIQIGMITFDNKPYLQFHLNRFSNKAEVENAINKTLYTKGSTYTYLALKYATDTSFTAANGARPNAAKIAIIITDGKSQDPAATAQEAQRLRDKGVTVFSIGVGTSPSETELKAIATDPDSQHVFVVSNFDALSLIKNTLQQKACDVKPTQTLVTPPPQNSSCGGKADIVFLLDKSGSVGQTNFHKMLDFVKDVSTSFNIGPNDVQVGVDTFSTSFNTEFTLGQFATKQQISTAVDGIHYTGGETNTGSAITSMTTQSFSTAAGHRADVPKIAIVVTDGKSSNPSSTAAAAKNARDSGIHILTIGVGTAVDDSELNTIASDPDSQNVYKAATFDSLKSLQGLLAAKACEQVHQTPSTKSCGAQADIVFMLDSSASVGSSNFKLLLSFVNSMVKDFDVGQDSIRIGVEEFSSRPYTEFHLNRYNNKTEVLTAVNHIPYRSGGTNTADALKYMKDTMFNQANGDRPGVPNIGIIITDGNSNRPDQTKTQAQLARDAGITLFSVGVGSGISRTELNEIASDPDAVHVFTVDDFSKLPEIKALFQEQACSVIPASLPPYIPSPSPSSLPIVDSCQDTLPNCAQYDLSACGIYVQWASNNCKRYCGICATSSPTVPPPCEDKLTNCPAYSLDSCLNYQPWAKDNCRKYCGFCVSNVGTSYFNQCLYNGKAYSQGEQWSDGCAYDCECVDASVGLYRCNNKCPTYYSLPPQCTLVQQQGQCCLQPVCNFDARYQTSSGQNVGNLNGNKVCVYNDRSYYQGQTWSVGCDWNCYCEDAAVGLWACQSQCATYTSLPSTCKLVKAPGECCAKPDCEYSTQIGTFTGSGQNSGPGEGSMATTPPPCVDMLTDCKDYETASCTAEMYRPWALDNCRKTCNLCNAVGNPGPNDVCVYNGAAYKQGETWDDGCEKHCVCENAALGYYRCDNKCPDYYNIPPACVLEAVPGQCCRAMRCSVGTVVGSQTVPNTIGAYPNPYVIPTAVPGLQPGATLAPGMTIPPYLTPAPGQTLAPEIVPGHTLAPGVTIPWNLTPAPGMTYAPTPYQTPAPLIPGLTLSPGQTIPPYITPVPGQTFGPGIVPGQSLAPGVTVPIYLTPAPGLIYAPVTSNPYSTAAPIVPGHTMAPGETIPPYATPAPGHTFGPGILPGQTLAPGMTVPPYLTPAPGQTYGPNTTPPPPTAAPLIPGKTLPPGQTIPPYITPVLGQTFAPGIVPGRTLAPGVTVPFYLTPAPGEIYAPMVTIPPVPLVPGKTLSPGQTLPPYITPAFGQTFGPGIVPGQTLAPGVTVPSYLTPAPGETYGPNTTPPGPTAAPLVPGRTLPPDQTIPPYITPAPGSTFGPGVQPGNTLAPGMTVPAYLTPAPGMIYWQNPSVAPVPLVPGQTLSPGQTLPPDLTPAPGQTFGPGILPGSTLAPGVTVPSYLTPLPGQTYGPYGTVKPIPLVPGWTLSPGQTLPPYITPAPGSTFGPEIKPGQTLAPGVTVPSYLTPAPGQIYAPDATPKPVPLVPGQTLAPGQTLPPYITPAPGSTFGPGIVPGHTLEAGLTIPFYLTPQPGQTYAPNATPKPVALVPGQTLAPGQTLPPYLTPAPGNTFGPGIVPGQTLAPGVTVPAYLTPQPGQTYAPNTMAPAAIVNINMVPPKLSGCVYKGTLYQQGQRWTDGCAFSCLCEDGTTGRYRCTPKCLSFDNLDSRCTLEDDPNDPCCKAPQCPLLPNGQAIVVVPTIGQGHTGYGLATYPVGSGGGTPTISTGVTSAPDVGSNNVCVYNGKTYQQNARWQDGCQYMCQCLDAQTGFFTCSDVCPSYHNLPSACRLIPDPNNPCCQTFTCDVTVTTASSQVLGGVPTPAAGVDYCVYNGRYYRQGEQWEDGCSLRCRCEDAVNKYYQCAARCASFSNVPLGCALVSDPKDPQCCKIPECDSATGAGGSLNGVTSPLGFIGTYAGNPRPSSISLSPSSSYKAACIYKGQIYSQGQQWQDGCGLDCECTNAATGIYTCTDRCPRYAIIPSGCKLVQDPVDHCCTKAECAPSSAAVCRDVLDNCYMYGKYACQAPYEQWARDNCPSFCGFCGAQTTVDPASCVDKLPNCDDYGTQGCVGQYQAWAQYNCPKFCGYCGGSGPITTASSVIVVGGGGTNVTQGAGGTCHDKLTNCQDYGKQSCIDPYRAWAIDNCPSYCNLCSEVGSSGSSLTGSTQSSLTGVFSGCYYNGLVYKHGEEWQDGCDYNCTCVNGQTGYYRCGARCPTYTYLPQGCRLEKPPNECCSKPVCDSSGVITPSTGCLYKGVEYSEGSMWNDGCDYKCTCVDDTTGEYHCMSRCVRWQLPAACTLVAPSPGKCCSTPTCPAGYTINYPPGYGPE